MRPDKFTIKSQEAIEKAQQLAQKKGNQQVDAAHLLYVLLEEGIVPEILKILGEDTSALKREVEAEIEKAPKILGATPIGQLYITQTLKDIFEKAFAEAEHLKDEFVSVEHLLLGIIGTKNPMEKILKKFGDNLLNATVDDLVQISGIGQAKALQIASVLALAGRLYDKQNAPDNLVLSAQDAILLVSDLKDKKQEHLVCLYLNARNALLKKETISIGTLDKSIIHPREIFAPGLEMHAAAVILVHNHPSGDPGPSEQSKREN